LLHKICKVIVDTGGYRFAWVGYAEQNEEKSVKPLAQRGYEEGYLDTLKVTWADTERGQGPTGTTIRTGKTTICKDIINDPKFAPWRDEASKRGYVSSISLPLIANGKTFGSLNIYAIEPDAFDYEEVKLLTELANDLAYGITTLRTRAEHKQAEEALQESEKKYRNLVDNALVGVYQTNIKGNFLYANEALARLLEFESPEDMMSGAILERCKNPNDGEELIEKLKKSSKVSNFELELLTKTGKIKNVLLSATLEEDVISGMIRDITKRKKAEEQIKQQIERLAALRDIDMAITASLDLRVTLNVFLEHVIIQLNADAATVLLLNPHTQTLEYGSGRGFRSNALKHTHLRLGEGHAGQAALERRTVSIPNMAKAEKGFSRSPLLATEGFISYYAVPLIAKGQIKGVLEIFHRAMLEPDQEWLDFLEALATQAAIAIDNAFLFDDLQRSNIELILAYDTTLEGWSKALDLRDKETEGHSQRVTDMTLKIARKMGVSDAELVHVRRGALLHDIGKMGIPDNILLKPGPLNDEEWKIMRKHPVYAFELLSTIAFLRPALDIPYYHYEKWDGTGYPRGLKGEQIPLSARIFSVVDVWDALCSDRPYRPAWPKEKAYEHISEKAGEDFDPGVVEVFLKVISEE